ncbi:MAG TPA: type II toxin-antitoxin system HicB family antitoxin [Patescibacteria group bacterium]|nr:type II toxin-antitoxin system HicB family antitoxin [Patescibacteria group bacterium]
MFSFFIAKKMELAKYKLLKDSSFFGEIPGVKGVWANAKSLEACRRELQEVLEDWTLLKIRSHEQVPGLRINFDRRRMVKKYA